MVVTKTGLRRVWCDLSPGFMAIVSQLKEHCYGLTTQYSLLCVLLCTHTADSATVLHPLSYMHVAGVYMIW